MESLELALRSRGTLVVNDLHYAGALLNPHFIKDMELRDDQNAMAGLMRVFQKLTDTAEEFHAVKAEFNMYFHTMPPYYGEHVWSPLGMKEVPHLWWFTNGSVGKMLPHIARRILAQVVSSSSYERNWSSYSSCIAKHRIDYFHLVRKTWCMSSPTQESLIKMCHLQMKLQRNGICKLLYLRTLILRDLWTFLMTKMMFSTLIHQTCPLTMRIPKGNLKNRMGCNSNLRESERMGGISKTGLHAMRTNCTLNHQENASKACLRLTLLVVMHH